MDNEKSKLTRREFLHAGQRTISASLLLRAAAAVGLVNANLGCGGTSEASAMPGGDNGQPQPRLASPRPTDWPSNIGNGQSVVILGAGIAGMSAAFELRKLGFDIKILEAQPKAGGRCQTIRAGDVVRELDSEQVCTFDNDSQHYFNPGPARIPHHHDLLLGYCRAFGVELEPFINDNAAAYFHSTTAFNGEPQVSRNIVANIRGQIGALLAQSVEAGNSATNLSASEQSAMLALLRNFGHLNANHQFVGSSRAGFPGQETANSRDRDQGLAPLSLSELLASNFWQTQVDFAQSIDQQATMLQPVGGMDKIARAFEEEVGDLIEYEAEVTRINKTTDGASVAYRDYAQNDQIEVADFCICTIPATVLKDIDNDFSNQHLAAINNFNYARSGKIAFQSPRFWEQSNSIYGGISWTNQPITQIWYPNNRFGEESGVLLAAYTFGNVAGDSFANLSPQARIDWALNQASQLHPQLATQASSGVSVSWPKMPYQLGAWGTSAPGVLTSADDNILFAGEHLSILQGWQEGAILSAYSAIDQVVQRLQVN